MTHQEMEIRLKELEKQVKALKQESCEDWRKTSVFKVEMDGKIAEDIKKIKELNKQPLITGVLLAEPKVEDVVKRSVLEDIKAELWDSGMNMTGKYQGIWVRYKDIEKAFDKHISGEVEE